jgi:succinyl-CoA synthetase alpha subunit
MDAVLEAVDAGLEVVVCTTANVPVKDMIKVNAYLRTVAHDGDRVAAPTLSRPVPQRMNTRARVVLIGPGSPGVFVPDKCIVGAIPPRILKPGGVGVLSRSGSLAYEVTWLLTRSGFGQSTVLGIGDGLIVGTGFADILAMFEDDPLTEQVVLIGEIGGREEQVAAAFIADHMTKPVIAFVVGQTAPPGRRMGHAGAIVEEYEGTAQQKIDALKRAGVRVARSLAEIPDLLQGRT